MANKPKLTPEEKEQLRIAQNERVELVTNAAYKLVMEENYRVFANWGVVIVAPADKIETIKSLVMDLVAHAIGVRV